MQFHYIKTSQYFPDHLAEILALIKHFYLSISHCEEDGTQNYLVFQPMYRYFKRVIGVGTGNYIYFWKSEGLSYEDITAPTMSDYKLITHN